MSYPQITPRPPIPLLRTENFDNVSVMDPLREQRSHLTRRHFFGRSAVGIGAAALGTLLETDARGGETASQPRRVGGLKNVPHFEPKAKRVIYLFQNGAPSHVDLFDYKPMLKKMHGTQIPDEVVGGK